MSPGAADIDAAPQQRRELPAWRGCDRVTRHFHEKAAPCQAVFLVVSTVQPDCRPTGGKISLQPFLLRKVFCSAIDTADRRPAGGAHCCHPEFSNHRFALLPSALFVERSPRCQLGVLDWKRVLPSRSRTECLCFRRRCSWRVPQSPELGDLVLDLVKRQLSSAPVVRCDCAMVRILPPSPTADEARSPVFAQPPQPLVSCRAALSKIGRAHV